MHSGREYAVIYFDIDNFKAYNDVYGFENGDRVLKHYVGILKDVFSDEDDFIGHIGGDDFVAILQGKNAASLCEEVIVRFTDTIQNFYNPNDLAKGYITTKNRHGIEEDFPFMSLSIVVVNSKHYDGTNQLSESMAALKKICKQKPGSNCVFG